MVVVIFRTEKEYKSLLLFKKSLYLLFDCQFVKSKSTLLFLKDVESYLEHDIRMDMDEFYKFDATIFENYIKVGKKADSIATLLKFLRR